MKFEGVPSDKLPGVLATGETAVTCAFLSLSARDPDGRDADYIAWHSLDHRPEQYRLAQLRNALRLVSTPACRAARAASSGRYDEVDHVMTYLFTGIDGLAGFYELGAALDAGGRMTHRLPSVGYLTAQLIGKAAAPRVVAGADVIPWRPALGVYLLIEEGSASPAGLIDLPGVAGVWWYDAPPEPGTGGRSRQVTYCFLDSDPVEAAAALGEAASERWRRGEIAGLLAAPFHTLVPYAWDRFLPGAA